MEEYNYWNQILFIEMLQRNHFILNIKLMKLFLREHFWIVLDNRILAVAEWGWGGAWFTQDHKIC